jgi:hypothetical protein
MTLYAQKRLEELERVQRKLGAIIHRELVQMCGNISYIEGYATAIRAIEDQARVPTEEIRARARAVSESCRLQTDFGADEYQRQREAAIAAAAIKDATQ